MQPMQINPDGSTPETSATGSGAPDAPAFSGHAVRQDVGDQEVSNATDLLISNDDNLTL